ncbi:MAG: hypothetical protein K2X82_12220 [Gemmataceae bacterium]|nr:hypothetical protein [Gemmataceae bacterium]
MTPIRIRTRLESDTPHLPTLAPFVGREVEIVVTPDPAPAAAPADPPAGDPDYWDRVHKLREAARAELARMPPIVFPGPAEWAAAEQAIRELNDSGFDWDVYRRNRELKQRQAEEEYREWLERQQPPGGEPS